MSTLILNETLLCFRNHGMWQANSRQVWERIMEWFELFYPVSNYIFEEEEFDISQAVSVILYL